MLIVAGLKDAVQVGAPAVTVTTAGHVTTVPAAFWAERVHVWVVVGEVLADPLAPLNVPVPKLPVHE